MLFVILLTSLLWHSPVSILDGAACGHAPVSILD